MAPAGRDVVDMEMEHSVLNSFLFITFHYNYITSYKMEGRNRASTISQLVTKQ